MVGNILNIRSYSSLLFALHAHALFSASPRQTVAAENAFDVEGWSPVPTTPPLVHDLRGRQQASAPPSVCGYVSGDVSIPLSCANAYCGLNTNYNVMGCCSSYSILGNGVTTLGQCNYQTLCYDSAELNSCTGACSTNSMVLKCANSAYPFCLKWTFTDVGFTILGCTTAPMTIPAQQSAGNARAASTSSVLKSSIQSSIQSSPAQQSVSTQPTASFSSAAWMSTFPTFSSPPTAIATGPVTLTAQAQGSSSSSSPSGLEGPHVVTIVSAVVGAAAGIALLFGGILFCVLRRKGSH